MKSTAAVNDPVCSVDTETYFAKDSFVASGKSPDAAQAVALPGDALRSSRWDLKVEYWRHIV